MNLEYDIITKLTHPSFILPIIAAGESVSEDAVEIPRMDARLAESLVRKWQTIKSQALGPDHCHEKLSEVKSVFFSLSQLCILIQLLRSCYFIIF